MIDKGNHRHFMQKEIFEQPVVVAQTLQSYLRPLENQVALPDMDFDLANIRRVTIVSCGTSYYAGLVAKYWFEKLARIPVDIRSEEHTSVLQSLIRISYAVFILKK